MTDQELRRFVAEKINEGVALGEIQKLLAAEHDTKITFFDLKMLAAELENVDWTRQDPAKSEVKDEEKAQPLPGEPGPIQVEVSKIARPGAAVNGTVRFPSGASAEWFLDRAGRLDFDNVVGEPTQEDTQEFVKELQKQLAGGAH